MRRVALRAISLARQALPRHWLEDLVALMTLKRWMETEGFPRSMKLGPNSHAWIESEVYEWLAGRPRAGKKGK